MTSMAQPFNQGPEIHYFSKVIDLAKDDRNTWSFTPDNEIPSFEVVMRILECEAEQAWVWMEERGLRHELED